MAYAERLPDEKKATARAFMQRALEFFDGLGVAVERDMATTGRRTGRAISTRCSRAGAQGISTPGP